ncbi:Ribosome maturation factor RimP [uncultured Paludibacter sp.]|nr:Ribosome maturation factor RimP [uncultured Paludibacter sp.]
MILKEEIIKHVESYLTDTDHYLVDVKVTTDNRISVQVDSFNGVSIDFCVDLNRYIESKLDRDVEDYELEVSSAGLTEPFKVLKQYEKNVGKEVEVLTKDGKKLTGILEGLKDTGIVLQVEKQVKPEGAKRKITVTENMHIHFENIKTTKYIIRFK